MSLTAMFGGNPYQTTTKEEREKALKKEKKKLKKQQKKEKKKLGLSKQSKRPISKSVLQTPVTAELVASTNDEKIVETPAGPVDVKDLIELYDVTSQPHTMVEIEDMKAENLATGDKSECVAAAVFDTKHDELVGGIAECRIDIGDNEYDFAASLKQNHDEIVITYEESVHEPKQLVVPYSKLDEFIESYHQLKKTHSHDLGHQHHHVHHPAPLVIDYQPKEQSGSKYSKKHSMCCMKCQEYHQKQKSQAKYHKSHGMCHKCQMRSEAKYHDSEELDEMMAKDYNHMLKKGGATKRHQNQKFEKERTQMRICELKKKNTETLLETVFLRYKIERRNMNREDEDLIEWADEQMEKLEKIDEKIKKIDCSENFEQNEAKIEKYNRLINEFDTELKIYKNEQ